MTFADLPQAENWQSIMGGDLAALSLEDYLLMPFRMAEMAYAWQMEMGQVYAGLLSPFWYQHAHHEKYQLEVPEPIEAAPEQDLFA